MSPSNDYFERDGKIRCDTKSFFARCQLSLSVLQYTKCYPNFRETFL